LAGDRRDYIVQVVRQSFERQSDGSDNELFISVETPSLPSHKTVKGKGKGKEKELAKNSRKKEGQI
jgi:hypothetical protein